MPWAQHLIEVSSWRLARGPECGPPPSLQPLLSPGCGPRWGGLTLLWGMLPGQLLEGACSRFSLPPGQGPANGLQIGPLGMVRARLERVALSHSQWLFVTHMPKSALSSPPTG